MCDLIFASERAARPQETSNRSTSVRELGWEHAVQIATDHLVAPTVGHLIERHELKQSLPAPLSDYCADRLRLNRIRNEKIMLESVEITRLFNGGGGRPILIKVIA